MENRVERALQLHKEGYNCAQAVACAYAQAVGVDEETLFGLLIGAGLGGGNMLGTCGALVGANTIASMHLRNKHKDKKNPKAQVYKTTGEMQKKFEEKNGSIICKELKGRDTGKVLRSCDGCIEDAARILEELLEDQ